MLTNIVSHIKGLKPEWSFVQKDNDGISVFEVIDLTVDFESQLDAIHAALKDEKDELALEVNVLINELKKAKNEITIKEIGEKLNEIGGFYLMQGVIYSDAIPKSKRKNIARNWNKIGWWRY